MGVMDDAEHVEPADIAEWSDWLARNHADAPGAWLVTPRSRTGRQTVDYESAVVEALRFGWVDSTTRTLDAERGMMWFSPRRPTSGWAGSNKRRIERLRAEGRLEPAGEAAVRVAQENGSWNLLDDVERLVVPADLAAALDALPGARAHWDRCSPSARRMALTWIVQAKRPETRARRVTATAERSAAGEPLGPG
ncbi:MAG: hypothetical protein AVDCRST_MAG47-487 [uncultured Nocardioidaceae bacterium]|uniref:Periplasmic membrane protein n=1 Tax=uncultured Nocardioidaceae bacterium TaxID=253824 RepID=A0A6J4MNU6_9ACTN|nr:MAG: hypothetical protein AVDCRST_MAG47-487 [uncultured Nocardioidaceae bacterium]